MGAAMVIAFRPGVQWRCAAPAGQRPRSRTRDHEKATGLAGPRGGKVPPIRYTLGRSWKLALAQGGARSNFVGGGDMVKLNVNGRDETVDVDPDTPLLWVLRDTLGLTGTKYGCGIAQCGACTVHVEGQAVRACVTPVGTIEGQKVVTIEGLSPDGRHPVQQAWLESEVPQCGYCQTGMIMATAALLQEKPKPSDADIDEAITNICRCGTYVRIRQAIHLAATKV
jgi:isoquinoline 1-oxidoreductase alpha subunit